MYQPRDYFMAPHQGDVAQYVPDNETDQEREAREAQEASIRVPGKPKLLAPPDPDELYGWQRPTVLPQGLVFDNGALRPITSEEVAEGLHAPDAEPVHRRASRARPAREEASAE